MLPLLKRLADSEEHKFSNLVDELGSGFALTDENLSKRLPSGTQTVFANRSLKIETAKAAQEEAETGGG